MAFSEADLLNWLTTYLLPFFRVAAFVTVAPIFSMGFVPPQVRILVALMMGVAIVPNVHTVATIDPMSLAGLFVVVQQVLIGFILGFVMQIVFSAIVHGGQVVGMQMGLGFAQMMDPQTGVSVPVVSQFFNLMAILLFLALNGHLLMIKMVAQSFEIMPVGAGWPDKDIFLNLVRYASWIFAGAVVVALPAVISLLMISVIMGVITRATPQMNIFAVGFSITITGGFIVIMMTLPTLVEQLTQLFGNGIDFMGSVLAGGV